MKQWERDFFNGLHRRKPASVASVLKTIWHFAWTMVATIAVFSALMLLYGSTTKDSKADQQRAMSSIARGIWPAWIVIALATRPKPKD